MRVTQPAEGPVWLLVLLLQLLLLLRPVRARMRTGSGSSGAPLEYPYELIILRGCSGSGKSTLASLLLQSALAAHRTAAIFSTDDFWINPSTGIYTHDLSRLSEAHIWNQTRATTAMQTRSHSLIFIDNTNLQLWEAKPYVLAALAHGYTPSALEPTTQWWIAKNVTELHARGTHGVPLEVIQRMVERFLCRDLREHLANEVEEEAGFNPVEFPPPISFIGICGTLEGPSKLVELSDLLKPLRELGTG
ncbi:hypothetical protein BC830DRAFT_1083303 [Chytriomyces sp. MP71]|nr:hypothetical protein BC830DRAFT_1083303 [Chytriomyces sp. MP71]